jgi:hypothetical protein
MLVLGAVRSFLEPFCGHLLPKIDKVSEELTLRYPHEGPGVGPGKRVVVMAPGWRHHRVQDTRC